MTNEEALKTNISQLEAQVHDAMLRIKELNEIIGAYHLMIGEVEELAETGNLTPIDLQEITHRYVRDKVPK